MKHLLLVPSLVLCTALGAQTNFALLGNLDYQALHNSGLSNLWVYTDEVGNEYALVGVNGEGGNTGGLSVVDVTDPANPVELAFIAGPTSIWREVKVWEDYVYVTTEANYGLLIVDLGPLPGSTTLPFTVFQGVNWETSHSLFIDEAIGRLYLNGSNRGNGGVIMYDLTIDPMAPVEIGEFDQWYCHDSYARGDTLYAAHVQDGFFSIVDVSDPASPTILGTQPTPSTFTHNVWTDDSGDFIFTTDEVSSAYIGSYDISDPSDILWQDQTQSDPGSGTIPHNTYWLNDFLVTSYYSFGVTIHDATRPHNLVEVGHYDTSPLSGDGFVGAWGTCPFLPSGNVVVSDIETGLWILAPTYVNACWLEGTVRDAVTTAPINGASITVLSSTMAETTGFSGQYATGTVVAGTYDVLFDAIGYIPQTITGVVLQNGVLTIQDADLVPLVPFDVSGQVLDAVDGTGVPDAFVQLAGDDTTYSTTADGNGNFTFTAIYAGTYGLTAGQWGWITDCSFSGALDAGSPPITVELARGWYDDFTFDFGWSVSGTAATGGWERDEPVGTTNGGTQSNPDVDADGDCADKAYVTGNGGGGAGNDDVDDGFVRLVSPEFDATIHFDPYLDLHYWFYNGGGSGTPNDSLWIDLTNGADTVRVITLTDDLGTESAWTPVSTSITAMLVPTSTMRLITTAVDGDPGHLVEGGIDRFRVWEHSGVGVAEASSPGQVLIAPNPAGASFIVLAEGADRVVVRDVRGAVVVQHRPLGDRWTCANTLSDGVYFVEVTFTNGARAIERMVVAR